ncbi:D-alanyl-D-alanine carboxypeptidase family protein [Streptomyces hesseae]|uniref:D-alanyl-D-alanine carboxypeptidase n=1 Tax=Streptomyces hesseae TaxID=3075519 RepID=A0ABU2SNR0_9ACTN|nr:D-alanyl-D-alanine carboxypeptidase [Streptomyces sp. DSM 40473]MDT0450626.1 D-alanyl-D-alanine carboxypeptidase [Streptomyces sp. DSM 40473]
MRSGAGNGPIGSSAGALREAPSRSTERGGTFTSVPTTTSHPPRYSATPRRRCAALLAAGASLLLPLAAAAPALAVPAPGPSGSPAGSPGAPATPGASATPGKPADGKAKPPPKRLPPAKMSTVGGELLGRPGPQVQLGPGAPELPRELSGNSWLVADAETGDILAANNAHWQLPPASTLKMLFADTVLPKFPKDKKHEVRPSDMEGMGEGSSQVGMKEGLSYSVHDMWMGVFLRSGNDAVHVLSAMNGGVAKTVRDMQEHADELQANDTHVITPDGYDAEGQVSSAYDLTLFARSGLQKADFREYCSTARTQFPDEDHPGKTKEIVNTNRLLTGQDGVPAYKGMAGVKNGSTTNAGNTFTGVAQHDGKKLLVTVMNPETKERNQVYKETQLLLDWGFEAAGHVKPVGVLVPPKGGFPADKGATGGQSPQGAQAAVTGGGDGMWTAVGLTGGALAVLAVAGFVVNRRHPLPERARRRAGGHAAPPQPKNPPKE